MKLNLNYRHKQFNNTNLIEPVGIFLFGHGKCGTKTSENSCGSNSSKKNSPYQDSKQWERIIKKLVFPSYSKE